jgi:lipopolysaccharide biosynthesis glycosyltransferase
MAADGIPKPKDKENRPRTAFSFCRFTIPERMGFAGRALYVDADMLVFSDVAELWRIPFGEQKILCTFQPEPPPAWRENKFFKRGRQFSVMLLDCTRLPWHVDEIIRGLDEKRYTYAQLMFDLCLVQPHEIEDRVPPEWNHLEHYEPGTTRLLHYTVVSTQPWRRRGNPYGAIWERHLAEAVEAGAVTARDLELGVEKGHLHVDLLRFRPRVAGRGMAERMRDAVADQWLRVRAAFGGGRVRPSERSTGSLGRR